MVDVAGWACPRVGVSGESMPRGWDGHGLSLGRVAEEGRGLSASGLTADPGGLPVSHS